jgi:glutamyl-tRNA reductase
LSTPLEEDSIVQELGYEELVSVPATRVGVIGVNFKTAPIEVREKLSKLVTIEALEKLQRENRSSTDIESLLLSTCNRVEVYFASEDLAATRNLFTNLFLVADQNQKIDYHTYEYADEPAIEHIFDVASGLDSLIVGEAQILQQVKQASKVASEKKLSGTILGKLFSKAFTTGREIREAYPRFTNGFRNSVSLSVVQLIADHFRNRQGPNILLVGSGKMIKLALGSLDNLSPNRVIVASRHNSPESILQADKVIPLSEIGKTITTENIDVMITATSSADYVITPEVLSHQNERDSSRQLLILDISVPRNVDPSVSKIYHNVKLINLDDLKEIVTNPELEAEKSPEKRKELESIHRSIEARTNEFMFWLKESSDITPIIAQLRKKADSIRAEELQNAISRLHGLSLEEKLVIQRMSERIIRRFLHEPTTNLKKVARNGESRMSREYASLLKHLFSLEEE